MATLPPRTTTPWNDFYFKNKNDGGPIQKLFETHMGKWTNHTTMHISNIHRLTKCITESRCGNMMLIPGKEGKVQVIHHGFETAIDGKLCLVFGEGNGIEDCAAFKVLPREEAVKPVSTAAWEDADDTEEQSGRAAKQAPRFLSLIEVGNAQEFGELLAEDNDILTELPHHFFIHPNVFALTMGANTMQSRHLAFEIINQIVCPYNERQHNLNEGEKEGGEDYDCLLAWLWATENRLLTEIKLQDAPTQTVLCATTTVVPPQGEMYWD